jgi:hypothetical protein
MGIKTDKDRRSGTGTRRDAGGGSAERGPTTVAFDRDADMGGSGWSGASGRGGVIHEGRGYAASNHGYGREGGYAGERYYGHEHGHEGGFPGDRRHTPYDPDVPYPNDRRFGHGGHPSHDAYGAYAAHEHPRAELDRRDDAGFIEERGFGHVPGQRWSGGYGGDRDRVQARSGGPGSTGGDYGVPGGRASMPSRSHELRRFSSLVDRGGRSAPSGGAALARPGWQRGEGSGLGDVAERGPYWGKGPKGYRRSDERTREDVCEAIARQGTIDASDVEVNVESSVVTLSGTVAYRQHKRALEDLVEEVLGVREVHNEIRLARTPPREATGDARDRTTGGDREKGRGAPS